VVLPAHPILHQSEGSFATTADARVAYLRGRVQYQRRWWPARRAAVAGVIRASAVLARFATLWILGSSRVKEFKTIWARREQWAGAGVIASSLRPGRVACQTMGEIE
jgi:hypothetical protein